MAPVGVRASMSFGKITVRTAAQNRFIETERLMPTSANQSSAYLSSYEEEGSYRGGRAETPRRSR